MLKKGNGVKPINGDVVTVTSEGRLGDGTVVDKEESCSFTLGDGDVIPGIANCIQYSNKNLNV